MLPREKRLTRQSDIVRVLRQGQLIKTPLVFVYTLKSSGNNQVRIAVVVGKKVDKAAVQRHRHQRRLRAIAAKLLPMITKSCDMVWVAQPAIRDSKSSEELITTIKPAIERICGQ